ncbi:MAG: autotransporter domain-containing protein, partial [Alphaproteobacteria bacterium]|nr:autotransporter domain-containing protein [Alphaproteobacteria bacterium]
TAFTYGGQLSGAGKLIKDGTGLLSLSGNNLFTGGIDILEGGVRLLSNTAAGTGPITTYGSVISYGNGVNSAAPIIVNSNTTQLEVLVGSAEQSGAISEIGGSRPIEKIGVGNLTLSGVNSYTGLTTITAGTLSAQGGSAIANTGAVTTAAAGTFALNTSETIGRFSGSGTLNLGSGTILTTGDASSTLFSGTSSGAGGLTKSGSGTFTLTGANSFSGALNVANGNLTVTPGGSLANMSLSVANGAFAFLGGAVQGVNGGGMTGSALGGVTVSGGGTMYLDDNTNLSGSSLTLAGGSNLNLFLTTNTAVYPQITVSGAANVAGANLGVYLDPLTFGGTTATSFTYSNVITGGSAAGTFGSVTLLQAPSALFTVAAIYSPTTIGLQINRNTFTSLGGGDGNDDNVGDGLDEIFEDGPTDPDLVNLINTVANSSPSSIEDIYAAIAGSENAESNGAAQRTDDPWKQSVAERVNAARTTGCTVAGDDWCLRRYAQASTGGEVMSDVLGDPTAFDWLETGIRDAGTTSVWARAIGAWGQTYGDAFAPGSQQITGGLITGVDRVFDSLLLAGLAAQYVETGVDFDASRNGSNIKSGQLGAYVSYGGAETYVNGNLSVIGSQASAERFVSVGPLDYDITSFSRSWSYTASVEAGTILENDGYRFEPSFALNYQGAFPGDYEERGGGGLSLLLQPEDSQSLRTIASARISRVFAMGDRKIVPQLRLDWRHEMLDRRQEFSAAFSGAPTVFFDVKGAAYARDTFSAGASMTMPLTGKITGYIDAQGAISEDSVSAMVSLGGRATW